MKNKAPQPTQIIIAMRPVAFKTSLEALNTLSNLLNATMKSSTCKIRKILKRRQTFATSDPLVITFTLNKICSINHGAVERRSTNPKKVVAT